MLGTSILLGLIGVFCILDSRLLGRLNFERPLIVSTFVGLALGNVSQGLMIGASLELMALGLVNIGAAATRYEYGSHYCHSFFNSFKSKR